MLIERINRSAGFFTIVDFNSYNRKVIENITGLKTENYLCFYVWDYKS